MLLGIRQGNYCDISGDRNIQSFINFKVNLVGTHILGCTGKSSGNINNFVSVQVKTDRDF